MEKRARMTLKDAEVRLSVLENTVLTHSTEISRRLQSIEQVLREIKDKQDNHVLLQSTRLESMEGRSKHIESEVDRAHKRIANFGKAVLAVILAIAGGLFSIPQFLGFK